MDSDKRHSLVLKILFIAVGLGILGDALLRIGPWGIGLPLFAVAFAGCGYAISRMGSARVARSASVLALCALPFAAAFAWRDSGQLKVYNLLVIGLLLGAAAVRVRIGAISFASLADILPKAVFQWLMWPVEAGEALLEDIQWRKLKKGPTPKLAGLGRGLLLATPLALVFGGLMASADAMFERALTPDFQVDGEVLLQHLMVWGAVFLLSLGLLRQFYVGSATPPIQIPRREWEGQVGFTEIATILAVLNTMFAVFVSIQFRYLFGGANAVDITPGLSYADYARKGFFELLTVVGLAIPLLIGMNALVSKDETRELRAFRWLAGAMVVMLFVVAASALQRMALYVEAYSLTPLRLYASAGMVFMVGLLGIFLGTTLRGHEDRFAFSSLALLGMIVLGLNAMNPDAFIARYNLRPGAQNIDASLLTSLSDDAVPEILSGMHRLPPEKQAKVKKELLSRHSRIRHWTAYNAGWAEANRGVAAMR